MKKAALVLSVIFTILTFIGAGYVLFALSEDVPC